MVGGRPPPRPPPPPPRARARAGVQQTYQLAPLAPDLQVPGASDAPSPRKVRPATLPAARGQPIARSAGAPASTWWNRGRLRRLLFHQLLPLHAHCCRLTHSSHPVARAHAGPLAARLKLLRLADGSKAADTDGDLTARLELMELDRHDAAAAANGGATAGGGGRGGRGRAPAPGKAPRVGLRGPGASLPAGAATSGPGQVGVRGLLSQTPG